jgi:Domain of unknown function (DUF4123)
MNLFADFVASALQAKVDVRVHRYLVVDAAATRPTNLMKEMALDGAATDLLSGEPCEWRESASPVLIELPRPTSGARNFETLRKTLLKWRYANCFVYVESQFDFVTESRLLAARTDAELPQNMSVVLRYFDSRVFGPLMKILNVDQRNAFLSAGTRWATPGRWGELQLHDSNIAQPLNSSAWALRLDVAQEAALIDAGETDAMVDLLLNQDNAVLLTLLPPEQFERINAALIAAKELQISDLPEQVAYCSVSLELGADFCTQEPWVLWVPQLKSKKLKFTEVLRLVTQE